MDIKLYHLFTWTEIAIKRARDLARVGRKDEARDWSRFILGAQILAILGHYRGKIPLDLDRLKADLSKLEDEVHPLSHADNTSELTVMRANLDLLAFGISALLERTNHNKKNTKGKK